MLKWFATHDGRMALLTLTIISMGVGVWHGVLLNRAATLVNRKTTERNYEVLTRIEARLERLIVERGEQ